MKRIISIICAPLRNVYRISNDYLGSIYSNIWYNNYCEVDLSKCELSDLDSVVSIYKNSFNGNAEKKIVEYQKIFHKTFFVMKVDNDVIGYCIYYIHIKIKKFTFLPVAILYSIAINSDKRGKGFGKILLKESITELSMNNIKTIYLYVDHENIHAISLYQNIGFTIIGFKDNICGVGKKCYKMELCTN